MGVNKTLQELDDLIKSSTKGLFYSDMNYFCSCGTKMPDLDSLSTHLDKSHIDSTGSWDSYTQILDKFQLAFNNQDIEEDKVLEDMIYLPDHLLCICVSEHDLGLTSDKVECSHCTSVFSSMDLMTTHRANKHNYSQRIVGENILFEKPDKISFCQSELTVAYFCPQPSCKYNITNNQIKYFTTFKHLKQHYTKMHAARAYQCNNCVQSFPLENQLKSHINLCGIKYSCETCGNSYKQYESLQTHGRRSGHKIPIIKQEKSLKVAEVQTASPNKTPIPIVPKPSKNHIQAALALSELSSFLVCRADIGIQTDHSLENTRSSPMKGQTPDRYKNKVTSATQTKQMLTNLKRKYPLRVNSEVQTQGEYLIKPKRDKKEKTSQASQCRMSPVKNVSNKDNEIQNKKNEMTTQTNDLSSFGLSVDIGTDWMEWSQLWPLVRNTNGTQTSPRVMQRKLSEDSIDSLPDLESAVSTVDQIDLDEPSDLVNNPNTLLSYHQPSTSVAISCRSSSESMPFISTISTLPFASSESSRSSALPFASSAGTTMLFASTSSSTLPFVSSTGTSMPFTSATSMPFAPTLNSSLPFISSTGTAMSFEPLQSITTKCTTLPYASTPSSSIMQFQQGATSQITFSTVPVSLSVSNRENQLSSTEVLPFESASCVDIEQSHSNVSHLPFSSQSLVSHVQDHQPKESSVRPDNMLIMRRKFGEVRQFSTETQTDLDNCQENLSWALEGDDLELPGAEKLLNKMETQETQTAHEDLLLCTNTFTQTGEESLRRLSAAPAEVFGRPRRQCNTESQTSLTGLVKPQYQIVAQDGSSVQTADAQLMTDTLL